MKICARGLEKRFGPVRALRGVDFDLSSGGCLAVLGANGAGKSTLLRILAGLSRESAGRLELDDQLATRGGARARRRRSGFAGHQTQLYPDLTARENLAFAARMHGLDDPNARADALLAAEGLTHVADRRIAGFSRGMAQRVAIARSLVHQPSLVLLDEPFTGLDIASAERLAQRIAEMGSEGRTRILVTHDLERAAALADSAVVLAAGRVAARLDGDALSLESLSQAVRNAPETAT